MALGLGLGLDKNVKLKKKFITTWKTDNLSTGSSNNNQVKLPLESTGTYNFVVDWGDGTKDKITVYNQAEVTHTYSVIGTYTIKIYGDLIGWRFYDGGDKLKLLTIEKFGCLRINETEGSFFGCSNLVVNANDEFKISGIKRLSYLFRTCLALNQDIKMDTSLVERMYGMYYGCSSFNKVLNYNTSNLNNAEYMFGATSYNQPINFNTENLQNWSRMFINNSAFNQDISNLSLKSATSMTLMLSGATAWSTENYDLFLIGAHNQALSTGIQSSVSFGCSSKYTLGGAAEAARTYLQTTKGWTITDSGGI